jgi:hypothetical protein
MTDLAVLKNNQLMQIQRLVSIGVIEIYVAGPSWRIVVSGSKNAEKGVVFIFFL